MGIDKDKSLLTAAAELRRHAEDRLRAKTAGLHSPLTEEETQKLLHELEVHQLELEMQNAELRQVRDEVEAGLEKYTDLYDFAPVGYFTLDQNGAITAVNQRGATLLGIECSRLVGRRFGLFVAVEARPAFADFLGKVFTRRGKEACEVALLNERSLPFIVQIEAMANTSGQECRAAIIDISDRRQLEEKLKISENRYRRLFETSKDGILILNADTGQLIDINPFLVELLGYPREELLEKKIWDIGVFTDIASSKVAFKKLQQEEYIRYEDLPLVTNVGRQIYVEFINNVYPVDGMKVIQCNIREITDRKQAEEEIERLNTDLAARAAELEAANRELEAFNYTVAHDLRQPLNVINSYCQVIQELCGVKLDEACKDYLRAAYDGTLRMNQLIDALLKFSRMAHVEMHREKIDLSTIAQTVAAELQLTAPERRVMFRIAEGMSVNGDSTLLRVVLENLFGNAWKNTGAREEAVIEFSVTDIDEVPTYFVRDNGAGFDMANAGRLFEAFHRLPGADEFRGFGIGLATVARIIQRHGGRVWAEGEPDKGATFFFILQAPNPAAEHMIRTAIVPLIEGKP